MKALSFKEARYGIPTDPPDVLHDTTITASMINAVASGDEDFNRTGIKRVLGWLERTLRKIMYHDVVVVENASTLDPSDLA